MLHFMTLALASTLFFTPTGPSPDGEGVIKSQIATYPMTTCVISGEELVDGEAVNVVVEGHLVRTCCNNCARKVKAAPDEFVKSVNRAVVAQQAAHYPLKTCLKDPEEALTGDAVDSVVGTRLVRTCCERCGKAVAAEPAKYMERLDAAYIAQQLPRYPVEVCVVSGEALDEDALDVLYGNTLVRLCCKGCKKDFKASPATFTRKLAMAGKEHGEAKHGEAKRGEAKRGEGRGHDGDAGEHHGRGDHDGGDHDADGDHDGGDHDGGDHDG